VLCGQGVANGLVSARLGDRLSKIWLDGRVKATLKDSTAQIGAPAAWDKGYDGKGVKVAALDTGTDSHHPDLAGRVGASRSFVPDETTEDGHGHGTHTASTVGGSGAASDGAEKGVAPGADLLIGKVLSDEGYGQDSAPRQRRHLLVVAAPLQGATLAVSYDDGATWTPVGTDGKSGTWTARYDAPRHGYVSLKAEGWDDAGNRIIQEVIRAYGLK
jgi:Subtilisin-like serine proteases